MPALDTSLIRILIVDNHAIVRAGLRLLLDNYPGFHVVGEAGHIADAVTVAQKEQPDIILFEAAAEVTDPADLGFAGTSADTSDGAYNEEPAPAAANQFALSAATTATQEKPSRSAAARLAASEITTSENAASEKSASEPASDFAPSPLFSFISTSLQNTGAPADSVDFIPVLFEAAPDAQIIVLTGSTNGQLQRRVVAQGAKGLLQKDCSPEVLTRAIECVYAGEVWIERAMMASVLAEIAKTGSVPATPQLMSLTAREREVIALLCEGLPNRQISSRLCISETTVRRHLTTIFAKLGVSDRLELVIYAYRHGLAGIAD